MMTEMRSDVPYAYLPIARWPLSLQSSANHLTDDAERTIGRFLAHLHEQEWDPSALTPVDFWNYAASLSHSNTCRLRHLKRLSLHLPLALPGCEPALREAMRKIMAVQYVEYGREHHRKRRSYRERKHGWELGVPIQDWPVLWKKALESYNRRLEETNGHTDLLDIVIIGSSPKLEIGARTVRGIATAVARLLYAAKRDPRISDPDRLAPDTLQAYLDALRERGAKDVTRAMEAKFLYSFATHVLLWPASERQWLKLTYQSLNRRAQAQPKRNAGMPMPTLGEVWSAGQYLWHRAHALGPRSQTAFRLARDGLVLCFSCNVPLRVSDLQPLRFGHELYRTDDGWALKLAHQTKTRESYRNSLLWPEINRMLDAYRDRWLPPERDSDYVWMDRKPSDRWLASVFQNRVGFNPHLIRDIVATAIAYDGGDASGVVPGLLGHADPRTSAEYIRISELIVGARAARKILDTLLEELNTID